MTEARPPVDTRAPSGIAGWTALGYFLVAAGLQLWNAIGGGEADVFLLSLIVIPWLALPVAIAAGLAAASPTRLGAVVFLVLELGFILSVVLVVVDFLYLHPSATGGVALLIWPLLQLFAIFPILLVAALFGWHMRPDFLKD